MGHSFVTQKHLKKQHLKENFPGHWKISTKGISGGKVIDTLDSIRQHIFHFLPDYVYIQVGGNDIDKRTDAPLLADMIMQTGHLARHLAPVKVIVGGIFPREKPRDCSVELYDRIKCSVNRLLEFFLRDDLDMHFLSTRKFRSSDFSDGVHLGEEGKKKWLRGVYRRIRSI